MSLLAYSFGMHATIITCLDSTQTLLKPGGVLPNGPYYKCFGCCIDHVTTDIIIILLFAALNTELHFNVVVSMQVH